MHVLKQGRRLAVASVCIALAVLAGCSNGQKSGEPQPAKAEAPSAEFAVQYQIGGGPTGGNFHPMAIGIQKVLRDKMGSRYSAAVAVTGGSIDNGNLLVKKEIHMGIMTQPNAASLYHGTDEWNGKPQADLQIITPLIPGHIRFAVRADARINSVLDIKGKRFSVGQTGGGGESFCRDAFKAFGFTFEDFKNEFLDLNGITDALKDGQLDGAAFAGSEPYAALMDLMTSMGGKIRIYSFSAEEIATITRAMPKYAAWVTRAGTYPNQDYDATIIAYHYYLACRADLPEGLAYEVCKGLNENQEWLSTIHSGYVNLDRAKAGPIMGMTDIPIHPGALRYWKEVGTVN